jgi:hypothetical protein
VRCAQAVSRERRGIDPRTAPRWRRARDRRGRSGPASRARLRPAQPALASVGPGAERGREPAPRLVTPDPGQRILHGSGLVKRSHHGITVYDLPLLPRQGLTGLITRRATPLSQIILLFFRHRSPRDILRHR